MTSAEGFSNSEDKLTHPTGVQLLDPISHSVCVSVILADDLGLKRATPIPGDLDVRLAQPYLDSLLRIAIVEVNEVALRFA